MAINESELRSKHSEEVEELHRQLNKQESILEGYKREHGKLEVFFNRVLNAIEPIRPFDNVYADFHKKSTVESNISAVMHITDSHMGAVQEADEIEMFNEFSPEICDKRNIAFAKRFIDWTNLHRSGYQIKNCHVLMTGDLISGDIHDELRVTNAFPVPEQIVRAAQSHAKQISLVAPFFEHVTIEFITEDNHSRLTKKPQAKEAGKNSYNYLVGILLKEYMSGVPNVQVNIYPMHEKVVRVNNRNYLLSHGHGIKQYMGLPWYSIERKVGRESLSRMNIIMEDLQRAKDVGFHKFVHGHFHVPFDHWLYSCTGSVSGTDAYDHQSARYSPPSQSSWLVHPRYGEFDRINFNLTYS